MSTTPVRPGRPVCDLPDHSGYTYGAIIRCDDCGRHYRYAELGGFWGLAPSWVRMTRLRVRWLRWRGQLTDPEPKPDRCGNCAAPFTPGKEWCQNPACVICPEHGGVRVPGRDRHCFGCIDNGHRTPTVYPLKPLEPK